MTAVELLKQKKEEILKEVSDKNCTASISHLHALANELSSIDFDIETFTFSQASSKKTAKVEPE